MHLTDRAVLGGPVLLRAAGWLCSAQLVLLAGSALVLRYGALAPGGLLPRPVYDAAFSFHASLTPPFSYAFLLIFVLIIAPPGSDERGRAAVAAIAVAVIALASLLLPAFALLHAADEVISVGLWMPALGVAASLAWAALLPLQLGYSARVVLVASAVAALAIPAARAEQSALLGATALLACRQRNATAAPGGAPEPAPGHLANFVISFGSILSFRSLTNASFLTLLPLLVSIGVLTLIARRGARHGALVARLATGAAVALLGAGALLRMAVDSSGVAHVADTLLVVASYHATVLGLALLALAAVLHAHPERLVERWWSPVAVVAGGLGGLAFVASMMLLGSHGMPRRYLSYLETFTRMQQAATAAAVALTLGAAFTLAALARGRRAR